jgi:hypothetical protein
MKVTDVFMWAALVCGLAAIWLLTTALLLEH